MRDIAQALTDAQCAGGIEPLNIRIMIVAAVRLYREGLATVLGARQSLTLVGLAADFDSAIASVRASRPDVILLDVNTPRTQELVRAMREEHPDAQVVGFAVDESEQDIATCAEAGVTSFVTRDVTVDGLATAISAAARGELTCSPRTAAMLFRRVAALSGVERAVRSERSVLATLTAREREIASLLAGGQSNKEIARALTIEVATVKNHVHNILEKLHATTRAQVGARVRVATPRPD
jgi:two-component system, NarL family, nitrate/nitrite response regulator NarL